MASVWVPFTSESKEAIADYDEIRKEMKLALMECGRKLGSYLRKRLKMRREGERRDVFERYIGEVSKSLHHIHGADTREVYDALLAQAKKRTRQADQVLNEDGKVVKAEDPSDQEGVLVVANAIPALAQSDRSDVKDSHLEAKKPFQNANVNAKTKRGKVSANESAKIKKSKRDDDSPTLFEAD